MSDYSPSQPPRWEPSPTPNTPPTGWQPSPAGPPPGMPGYGSAYPAPKRASNLRKILLIVGAFLLVVVLAITALVIFVVRATQAPVRAADSFVSAVRAQNGSEAYSLMSTEAHAVTSQSQMSAVASRIGAQIAGDPKVTDRKVGAATGSGKTAQVLYKVPGRTGTLYFKVVLVEENDTWKVFAFNSSATAFTTD